MKIEDLKVGGIYYSKEEDKLYKVLAIGEDWLCVIEYSYYHCIAFPSLHNKNDFNVDILTEDTSDEAKHIFDSLYHIGFNALKPRTLK